MSEGEEEIGALYDALAPYLTTDMSRGRLVNTLWSAREYARTTPLAPEGSHEIGSDGFMEFHADDDALKAMVLELFLHEGGIETQQRFYKGSTRVNEAGGSVTGAEGLVRSARERRKMERRIIP